MPVLMKPLYKALVIVAAVTIAVMAIGTAMTDNKAEPLECKDGTYNSGGKRCCMEDVIVDTQTPGGMKCPLT